MSFTTIQEALASRIDSMATSLPIADENRKADFNGSAHLEWAVLPGAAAQAFLGGKNKQTGILQITVVFPKYEGWKAAKQQVDIIAGHFKRGTAIDRNGVRVEIDKVYPGPPLISEDYRTPVTIVYRAYTEN